MLVVAADLLKKHLLGVFVGDVADHEGGPAVGFDLNWIGGTMSREIAYSWF